MKSRIVEKKPEGFQPFTLELTIETIEEARLLFHCFNKGNLEELIVNNLSPLEYNLNIANNLDETGSTAGKILDKIRESGLDL